MTCIISICSQPNKQGKKTVQVMKTQKTNTLIPWKNFLSLSCFLSCKAFVSVLIQAELFWSILHICLQSQSIPVWILNTALKHFKKHYAKDRLLFSEKATTPWLSCMNSNRGGIEEICILPWNRSQFKSVICNTHLHSRSSEKVVLP